jgi:hypothetical protein
MNTTELLAIFRDEVADTVTPYLWSDALLYAYMDDAQKQFFRWTHGIEDARSFTLALATGTEWYLVDPLILRVKSASWQATGMPIPVLNIEQVEASRIVFNGASGSVMSLISGMEKGHLRTHQVPGTDENAKVIELQTTRLPHDVASGDEFECDAQHVLSLMLWMKHKAYAKQDADTYDIEKSKQFRDEFRLYCVEAKQEQQLLTRNPPVVKFRW